MRDRMDARRPHGQVNDACCNTADASDQCDENGVPTSCDFECSFVWIKVRPTASSPP
jgi:hypothetical protein